MDVDFILAANTALNNKNMDSISYPSFQATWQDGKYNFTVRGEDAKAVIEGLSEITTLAKSQIAFHNDIVDAPATTTEKCQKCGSSMHSKVITSKKDGSRYPMLECDNVSCKDEKGYRTARFIKNR